MTIVNELDRSNEKDRNLFLIFIGNLGMEHRFEKAQNKFFILTIYLIIIFYFIYIDVILKNILDR